VFPFKREQSDKCLGVHLTMSYLTGTENPEPKLTAKRSLLKLDPETPDSSRRSRSDSSSNHRKNPLEKKRRQTCERETMFAGLEKECLLVSEQRLTQD
jgi:hypothetical protein